MISNTGWQATFIASNILALGYNAWCGFLSGERGALVCSLNAPQLSLSGESFGIHFVPRSRLAPFLKAWLVALDAVF